jgi:anti-sigma factor RsiW
MTDPSDEMLMALADAQIGGPEAEALRRRIMADPALAERFAIFTETRSALQAAFAPGDTPEALMASIHSAPPGDQAKDNAVVLPFRRPRTMSAPMALAASLLVAVGVGSFLAGRSLGPVSAPVDPGALAAADLATSGAGADTALAGGGTARVLGTYLTDRGLCRLIELDLPDERAERAVVCRDPSRSWVVVAAIAAGHDEAYIPASDGAAALIDQVLDDLGAGQALTPEEEAAALAG